MFPRRCHLHTVRSLRLYKILAFHARMAQSRPAPKNMRHTFDAVNKSVKVFRFS
jgi:hypothetical protein